MNKPLVYLAGDIMSFGSNLARQYEYDKFKELGLDCEVYSPVMNKSINDKNSVTEEENNKLAEKITEADMERMWNADYVVISPEQSAIGTLCELGTLYGWKAMTHKLAKIIADNETKTDYEVLNLICQELIRQYQKEIYAHYFDIRNTELNEKGWRRSFSINQLLHGQILECTEDHMLHKNVDEIFDILKEKIK